MFRKWREMSSHRQRSIVLGVLGSIMLLMVIGYAAFSSQLNINGTSNISSNWDIRITNIESSLYGGATNATEPTYDNENGLTASFSTNLVSPGDYAEYTITVRNNGDIDATLTSIDVNTGNNDAIVFETSGLSEGDNLLKQTEDELIVKVSYSDSVTSQPQNTTSNLTVTLTYEQANGGVPPVQTETAADQLKALAVTEGAGLYADTYEEGRYIYKGANPNNYITFNNETWRIVSVENDGTIKIMRNESIGDRVFDTLNGVTQTGSNVWSISQLSSYLNHEYFNDLLDSDKIVAHDFGVGAVTSGNNNLQAQIESENITKNNNRVGLISVSDYIRTNNNVIECGSFSLINNNKDICENTNWINSLESTYTINPEYGNEDYVLGVGGYIITLQVWETNSVLPALYLTSNITLSGTGTVENPYVIENA